MFRYRTTLPCISYSLLLVAFLSACGGSAASGKTTPGVVNVVAAENFYGNLAKQIGTSHVNVTSILSNPNVDPHEYASNVGDAEAVAQAQLVIENGGGYDDWMEKQLSTSPNENRVVLKAFNIATTKLPDNEHVWYSPDNALQVAQTITDRLKTLDSADASSFDSNFQTLKQGFAAIQQKMGEIKAKYNGTPIGLTETMYQYQAQPMGLVVRTPNEFQKAVAEANDPPADTVATAEDQIKNKRIKVLIYNEQTVSAVTTRLQNAARAADIPIVPVTETMPAGKNYQTWMLDQLNDLERKLAV